MSFHFTSLMSLSFFCGIAIPLVRSCFLRLNELKKPWVYILVICLSMVSARLLIPIEFSFAKSVPIHFVLPVIMDFLWHTSIFEISKISVTPLVVLSFIWIFGAVLTAIKTIAIYAKFRTDVLASRIDKEIEQSVLAEFEKIKGRKPRPFLIISDAIDTPIIFGYLRPVIALPPISLSGQEWELVLRHELNHYYKGDQWTKLVYLLLRIVYWWNPFCYSLGGLISELLEVRTDNQMFSTLSKQEKMEYLTCILKIAKNSSRKMNSRFASAFGGIRSGKITSHFMFSGQKGSRNSIKSVLQLWVITVILIAATTLSVFVVFEPFSIKPQDEMGTFALDLENAYLVRTSEGELGLYQNGEYVCMVSGVENPFEDLYIYENIMEVRFE